MKKTLVSVLTTAIVAGAVSTTMAAANPFSDVPADHWAYDAVTQLAASGIIDGYGDSTYQGSKLITRYEMAQMVAKAMAKNPTGADKAVLDRLAAEFGEELNNLGVRVSNLEKHADKVSWQGKIEYTYKSNRFDPANTGSKYKTNDNGFVFRLEPTGEINEHWKVKARLDTNVDMKHDTQNDVHLVRAWAEGNYDNFNVKVGRVPLYTNEDGIVWDSEYSGGEVTFGKLLSTRIFAGRLSAGKVSGGIAGYESAGGTRSEAADGDTSSIQGINIQYSPVSHGFLGGVGYYHLQDDDFGSDNKRNYDYNRSGREDEASIWSVHAGYKFSPKAKLFGAYANNTKADYENKSWQLQAVYGTYGERPAKGAWSVWAGYKQLGSNTSLQAINWDNVVLGTKGVFLGGAYAPMKNMAVMAQYFRGSYLEAPGDAERLFGRVEFFF